MGKRIKPQVDLSTDENAAKITRNQMRLDKVIEFIEDFELPRDNDIVLDVPISLIDSKLQDENGDIRDNYFGRSISQTYMNSPEFIALKKDIFRSGIRVPINLIIAESRDQIIVSDGRNRLAAVRVLLNEALQLEDKSAIQRFSTIKAVIKAEMFDRFSGNLGSIFEEAFFTNHYRRDDTFLAEAWAVGKLFDKGESRLSIEEKLGKKRSWVKERLNLYLCCKDTTYGTKLLNIITENMETNNKLTKKLFSSIFSKDHVANKTVSQAYDKLKSVIEDTKKKPRIQGGKSMKSIDGTKLNNILSELRLEFDEKDGIDIFIDKLTRRLKLR